MPIYAETISVPANTPEDNPVKLDIQIKEQFITRMEVGFEDGCGWMVKVQIRYGIKVFFPVRKETWLTGNNETIGWDERFTMPAPNEILTVYACSPGTKYDHNVFIRIMTLPKGFYFLESLLDKLYRLFERII
jgi:hypothetical protein